MAGKKNLDDRQIKFLSYYLDPKSETWNNALQSAIRAGFSPKYANQIVSQNLEWVNEGLRKREVMLVKAERNMDEILDMPTTNETLTKHGEKVTYKDPKLIKTKADVSMFVAETVGKRYYSKKNMLEDPEGNNILIPVAESLKKLAEKK